MTAWAQHNATPDPVNDVEGILNTGKRGGGSTMDNGPVVIALTIILLALSTIVVFLRLYTRHRILNSTGIDDYLTLAGLILAAGHALCTVLGVALADLGKHIWMVPFDEMLTNASLNLKLAFAGTMMSYTCTACLRASIICFLLRLKPSRNLRLALQALLAMVIGLAITTIFTVIFRCFPVQDQFSTDMTKHKKCMGTTVHSTILPSCFVALNVLIYIVPLPLLLNLDLPMKKRMTLLAAYHLGFLGVVGCILQLVYARRMLGTTDPLWDASFNVIWLLIEVHSMLIGCSAPILKALYAHVRSRQPLEKDTAEIHELDRVEERMKMRQSQHPPSNASNSKFPCALAFLRCAPKEQSPHQTTMEEMEISKETQLKIQTFDPDYYADTPPSTAGKCAERPDASEPEVEYNPDHGFSFGGTAPLPHGSTEDMLETGRASSSSEREQKRRSGLRSFYRK
ncbi:hypothetical protein BJ508DRAFT_103683 [Ascobolus immersus RN42]|uniref:Rhodopsin domain-containing protein n=1 Tax=Ascobolus immersus RN42 TaxID=1160509 RepID=A0A3N4H946_ASCIM|nr:hypothetical protein BJ508DRAFT_103683 [Ascobolus immersus RN42]